MNHIIITFDNEIKISVFSHAFPNHVLYLESGLLKGEGFTIMNIMYA
jgi:hypothetical protein